MNLQSQTDATLRHIHNRPPSPEHQPPYKLHTTASGQRHAMQSARTACEGIGSQDWNGADVHSNVFTTKVECEIARDRLGYFYYLGKGFRRLDYRHQAHRPG